MLETPLRKLAKPWLDHAAEKAEHAGVSANAVTLLGLVLAILGVILISFNFFGLGIIFIFFNRLCDALDGAVARLKGPTAFGGVLDSASDFLFYAGVPFGFALANPDNAVAVAFLLFGRTAYASADYAYASFSAKFKSEESGTDLLHGVADLVGPPETFIFFALMAMFGDNFGLFCYIYGGFCFVAAGARVAAALGETPSS